MTNLRDLDIRGDYVALSDEFAIIDYPAYAYLHALNPEAKPISADKGGRHLGEAVPGIAVPFPSRRHGWMHKHFGIGFYEGGDGGEPGEPFAYGKGVSLTSSARAKTYLAAAMPGEVILLNGVRYRIATAPNDNINLIRA
jgi:hypothetical protein